SERIHQSHVAEAEKPAATEKPVATEETVVTEETVEQETSKEIPEEANPAVEEENDDEIAYYTVKKGDTAFEIDKKHNISMGQLKKWNNLDFSEIKIGAKLRVK